MNQKIFFDTCLYTIVEFWEIYLIFFANRIKETPNGKFINYHAGPAPEVELGEYPIIASNVEDPLHVLERYLSKDELIKISSEQLKKLKSELPWNMLNILTKLITEL